MRLVQGTVYAVLTAATLAFAPAANADNAKLGDCVHMARQVAQALDEAQPGQTTDTARSEALAGRSYCLVSMYDRGVAHYAKALQLLGKG